MTEELFQKADLLKDKIAALNFKINSVESYKRHGYDAKVSSVNNCFCEFHIGEEEIRTHIADYLLEKYRAERANLQQMFDNL